MDFQFNHVLVTEVPDFTKPGDKTQVQHRHTFYAKCKQYLLNVQIFSLNWNANHFKALQIT